MRLMGEVGQIEIVQANLRVASSVERALDEAQACVNLVGVLYESGRQSFAALHAAGAETVAKACAARGVDTLVQMSALGVDPGSSSRYAATKAEGEAAARRHVPAARLVRPSIVFGQDDQFFNRFAAMSRLSPVLPLPGGGANRYQPVYVGDVAAAIGEMVTRPETAGRTYELGGPGVYSFAELMRFVLKTVQRKRLLLPLPFPVAGVIGALGELQSLVMPPILTRDQVELLHTDNVCSGREPGLSDLGVTPAEIEAIVPTYLYRYRPGGQFAEPAEVVSGSAA
jgi:NADH dehydrogenase